MALSKESKLYIIIAFIVFVIIMFLCLKLENKNKVIESQNTYIEKLQKTIDYYKNFDSTYVNKRDSIEYNIIKRDIIHLLSQTGHLYTHPGQTA